MHVRTTIAYAHVGHGIVFVSTREAPDAGEWAEYIEYVKARTSAIQYGLVLENGPGPTAAQRRSLLQLMAGRDFPTAVLMRSALARGVLTALSWFSQSFEAFGPDEIDAALEWLAVDRDAREETRATARLLQQRLGVRD